MFLQTLDVTEEIERLFAEDVEETGSILVIACTSAYDDSYCALAHGQKLANVSDGATAAAVTVNDALGAHPDAELRTEAPREVVDAVTFGRPIATTGEPR